jgi:SecD/SecF fusion protein
VDEKLKRFVYVSVHPEASYRELDQNEWQNFVENEKTKLAGAASLETSLSRVTQIDPSIGSQAKQQATVAIILSLIAMLAYIWIRFGTARYGLAAIVATVHDVIITLGLFTACTYLAPTAIGKALLIGDFKINLEIIAAFLTLIGYSVNDTIVVFDRIRENRGRLGILTPEMISASINQTLSRTLLTSGTTLLAVVVMYLWGGPGLRGFTFVMLVGILIGTYSSIAIASPILLIGKSKGDQAK